MLAIAAHIQHLSNVQVYIHISIVELSFQSPSQKWTTCCTVISLCVIVDEHPSRVYAARNSHTLLTLTYSNAVAEASLFGAVRNRAKQGYDQ